jgi:ABC-type transport system involved in multi-copper enzyme maturation permease subunit
MIFASTKVVDEEIENRTMLTLMSKPVSRWQVILGKYLGVLLLIFVTVAALTNVFSYLLPSLGLLDLNQRLVFGNYVYGANDPTFAGAPTVGIPTYHDIWNYVGVSTLYAVFYIGAALALGMALFRSRELT